MFKSSFITIFGEDNFKSFSLWMSGQTFAVVLNPFTNKLEDYYYYANDIKRWLDGLPVID